MNRPVDREFYVGYAERAPEHTGRFVRGFLLVLAVAVLVAAALAAVFQSPVAPGTFEFGVVRDFEGVLYEDPLPLLRLTREVEAGRPAASLLLVGLGKQGLPSFAAGSHGRKVRFRGSLIYREGLSMIEMNEPGSFAVLGDPQPHEERPQTVEFGRTTLVGELVDTKCFLGVMRPATGKVHRACAVRCLDGGVPPGLLVRGEERATTFLLAEVGEKRTISQWAGRTVRVVGTLVLEGEVPVIRTESLAPLAGY